MYKKVLVPLDGSELAEVTLVYAKELAGRMDLEVILLHVGSPGASESMPLRRAYVEQAVEMVKLGSAEVQKKFGLRRRGKAIKVRGELVAGYPADEILRYAGEHEVDLILMATHGWSGIKRWLLGSVADKVLRASVVPVWLVRATAAKGVVYSERLRFLVPLDGSELAELVLPHVEALAKQRSTEPVEVVLVRVCEPLVLPAVTAPEASLNWGKMAGEHMVKCRQSAEKYLSKIEKRFEGIGAGVSSVVLEGQPADGIIDYANKNRFDLVVMATHGRSGISRWAYGSVAGKVLLGTSSPVFLVRPPSTGGTPSRLVSAIRNLPPV